METTGDKLHRIFGEALHDPKVAASGLIMEFGRRCYLAGRDDANLDAGAESEDDKAAVEQLGRDYRGMMHSISD